MFLQATGASESFMLTHVGDTKQASSLVSRKISDGRGEDSMLMTLIRIIGRGVASNTFMASKPEG